MCSVNLQHHCDVHNCTPSEATQAIAGHKETSNTRPVIVHKGNQSDFVLNTAKMRDAKHIQKLCEPLTPLDIDWAIMQGCAREIDHHKSMQATNIPQSQASSSGLRGRGAHASRRGQGPRSTLSRQSILSAD